jgi:PhnB protein
MSTDQRGPANGVTPHLTIADNGASEAIEFYKHAFAAGELDRNLADDGKRLLHAHLRINDASLMLNDDFPEYGGSAGPPAAVTLHLQVQDPNACFKRVVEAGATIRMLLDDQFWGDRYGQVENPFGHRWSIGGPVKS